MDAGDRRANSWNSRIVARQSGDLVKAITRSLSRAPASMKVGRLLRADSQRTDL